MNFSEITPNPREVQTGARVATQNEMDVAIMLVDDHCMLREGLRAMLDGEPGLRVVGEAADGREAIALARTLKPDVVIMDVGMKELNGVDATRQLLEDRPELRVIALSTYTDAARVVAMLDAGACGYVIKSAAYDELRRAVDAAVQGQTFLSPQVAGCLLDAHRGSRQGGRDPERAELSLREREVLQLIAEGRTSAEIGERLYISVATVDTHRRNIGRKIGYRGVAELTKYAIRHGLTPIDT